MLKKTVAGLLLSLPLGPLVALAGCGMIPEMAAAPANAPSPAEIPVPSLPAGSFDRAAGQSALGTARQAEQGGDHATARIQAEAALRSWPGDPAAWEVLATAARGLGDQAGQRRAAYFHDQVEAMNAVPARVAALGFANLASTPIAGPDEADRHAAAERLAAFYNSQDRRGFSRP